MESALRRIVFLACAASMSACALVLGDFQNQSSASGAGGGGGATVGSGGACTSAADREAISDPAKNFDGRIRSCSWPLSYNPKSCITGTTDVSSGCADCWAAFIECGKDACALQCIAPTSECYKCVAAACDASLATCIGLALDGDACSSDLDCVHGACVGGKCTTRCQNGVKDGDESDVDCGGACAGCGEGYACDTGNDCQSRFCLNKQCRQPTCSDGYQNGYESDVDCGQDCPCANGKMCFGDADCASGYCNSTSVCAAPSCGDGVQNQTETDVDCGGSSGCPKCGPGKGCESNADCMSGTCTSGACG
jgi:hypothetical protein